MVDGSLHGCATSAASFVPMMQTILDSLPSSGVPDWRAEGALSRSRGTSTSRRKSLLRILTSRGTGLQAVGGCTLPTVQSFGLRARRSIRMEQQGAAQVPKSLHRGKQYFGSAISHRDGDSSVEVRSRENRFGVRRVERVFGRDVAARRAFQS